MKKKKKLSDIHVPAWVAKMDRLHRRASKRRAEPYGVEDSRFLALACAGEAGELANVVKKEWRGDFRFDDERYAQRIAEEAAGTRIYLELVVMCFGIDLDAACDRELDRFEQKLKKMRRRAR